MRDIEGVECFVSKRVFISGVRSDILVVGVIE